MPVIDLRSHDSESQCMKSRFFVRHWTHSYDFTSLQLTRPLKDSLIIRRKEINKQRPSTEFFLSFAIFDLRICWVRIKLNED